MSTLSTSTVAPPTPQEIHRKLSLHSASSSVPITPGGRRRSAKSQQSAAPLSSTESDSDGPSGSYFALFQGGGSDLSSSQPPLSVIVEHRPVSGEESDDEEDEEGEWMPGPHDGKLEEANEEAIVKSGYLWKKGERRKTWKKRWFVLRTVKMAYYKNEQEYQLLRLLDLHDVHTNSPSDCSAWVKALNDVRTRLRELDITPGASTPVPSTPRESGSRRRPPPPAITTTRTPSTSPFQAVGLATFLPRSPTSPHGALSSDSDDPFTPIAPLQREGPSSDPNIVILSGYLLKCGSKRKAWHKRWFTLTGEKLAYSKSHMDTKHVKHVPLDKIVDAIEYGSLIPKYHNATVPSSGTGGSGGSQSSSLFPGEAHGSHTGELDHTFKIITTQ
ncbi:hypothetical protein BS47DRAFT_1348222, partial [Hydnum rufescens UP504]